MTTGGTRGRGRGGPGRLTWVALGGAALVILVLTFALGMLVGRQWARQTPPAVVAEVDRRAAAAARRPGLAETGAERAAAPQEKLTFYQTLTAPLGALPPPGKPEVKTRPAAKPRATSEPGADRVPEPRPAGAGGTVLPTRAPMVGAVEDRLVPVGGEHPALVADWAVQVGVFKSSSQAQRVRKSLADAGLPARVTPVSGGDGHTWYRVRVGGFKTRDQALKTAERVRADRSLPTFVTTN